MAKGRGLYKSEKRKKELVRQKKKEEKMKKRLMKDSSPSGTDETMAGAEGEEGETPSQEDEDSPAVTEGAAS